MSMNAVGRNEPCPCGSGKKYKKCCLDRDEALARQTQPAALPVIAEDDFIAELLPAVDKAVDRECRGRSRSVAAQAPGLSYDELRHGGLSGDGSR